MGRLILILGGQKSGKSSLAARHAAASGRVVVVVTPAVVRDAEFAARVERHRRDRPAHWRTVETFDLAGAVAEAEPGAFVLVDALDTWLAESMETAGVSIGDEVPDPLDQNAVEAELTGALRELSRVVAAGDREVWVIAGQPGLGVHAGGPGARRYVDLHGLCVQALSTAADDVRLVVGGRSVSLERDIATGEVPPAQADGMSWDELVAAVRPTDADAAAAARERQARLAKPPGSLGRLEDLGARLAAIAGRCPPPVPARPAVVVAAADHGVHGQGVSDWPQAVTSAMVSTMAAGGAAVNAIARVVGATVTVLDVGTIRAGAPPAGVRDLRVRAGTRDLTVEPAMTESECVGAIEAGARVAGELVADGVDLLVIGEVGIANTTASAALVAALTAVAPRTVVGRGANLDDGRLPRKLAAVEAGLARHGDERDPIGVLASLGGLEHAALVGVVLAGAAARVPVVVDGVVSGAAALAAVATCPDAASYLIPGHVSAEAGGRVLSDRLGRPPLVDLELRLGEGTGALLAVPLVRSAAAVLAELATLDSVVGP